MKRTIEEIFDNIKIMHNHDLRFGQIVSNVFYELSKDGTDPFYIDDERFLEHLKKYVNK